MSHQFQQQDANAVAYGASLALNANAALMQQQAQGQQGKFGQLQQTVCFAGDAKKHVDGLLAENERLRKELDAKRLHPDGESKQGFSWPGLESAYETLKTCLTQQNEHNAALRRELENLKRRSEGCIADIRGEIATVHASREGLILDNAFLKRELDRERSKTRKRGL